MADHVIVSKFTYILYISRIYPTFINKNSMQKKTSWHHSCFPTYPLVICYIAIENGPVETVSFPIKKTTWYFSIVMLVYLTIFNGKNH